MSGVLNLVCEAAFAAVVIQGDILAAEASFPGPTNLLVIQDFTGGPPQYICSFYIRQTGTYRIRYTVKNTVHQAHTHISKNTVAMISDDIVGPQYTTSTFTHDLFFNAGDELGIYSYSERGGDYQYQSDTIDAILISTNGVSLMNYPVQAISGITKANAIAAFVKPGNVLATQYEFSTLTGNGSSLSPYGISYSAVGSIQDIVNGVPVDTGAGFTINQNGIYRLSYTVTSNKHMTTSYIYSDCSQLIQAASDITPAYQTITWSHDVYCAAGTYIGIYAASYNNGDSQYIGQLSSILISTDGSNLTSPPTYATVSIPGSGSGGYGGA